MPKNRNYPFMVPFDKPVLSPPKGADGHFVYAARCMMKRHASSTSTIVLLMAALTGAPSFAAAATSAETRLTTQSREMDGAAATHGENTVANRISADYTAFAGSRDNSDALVSGLRSGSSITLTSTDAKGVSTSTTFTPPTGTMGYGNVYTSLALAKQQLAGVGITDPSAQELQAALVGGTVTTGSGQTTTLTGVLELRAQGMGWGQIAQQYGYKLGPVISGMRSSNANLHAAQPTSGATGAVTAAGSASRSGVVNAGGAEGGQGNAYGRGIVTGAGDTLGARGNGNAYGRGIVTGGGNAAQAGARSAGQGKAIGKTN
jgi:hypothetical protein